MSDPLKFSFDFSNAPGARPRDPDQPMRMLVLGNFSGRDSDTGSSDLAQRKILRVDVDNFESVLKKVGPVVPMPVGDASDASVEVVIQELDDFHPDQLYRDLPVFQQLRDLRKRLLNPDTFAQAAAELGGSLSGDAGESEPEQPSSAVASDGEESDSNTLDRILGGEATRRGESSASPSQTDISSLLQQIVAPHIVPGPDPRQEEYVQYVDAAVSALMRSILHGRSFQPLEATWRALQFLISNVETSEDLQVFLWDVTKAELHQASESDGASLQETTLFRSVVTQREEEPWSVLVSDFSFDGKEDDLVLLSRLGAVAAHAGAPLLASASSDLVSGERVSSETGSDSVAAVEAADSDSWRSLRSSGVAPWIGLVTPRFLLRLPYGAATDAIDAFAFEEIEDLASSCDGYLWGASSLLAATLLATSFCESGWAMTPGDDLEMGDLPAVTYSVDGESQLKPCAETALPERVGEAILARGLMPLLSFKNRNAARLLRFQSVAEPPRPLSGPWA